MSLNDTDIDNYEVTYNSTSLISDDDVFNGTTPISLFNESSTSDSVVAAFTPSVGNWTEDDNTMMMQITTTVYNETGEGVSSQLEQQQILQFWIGVGLSISSSLFIGLSFIIKKKALIRLSRGGKRANQGGYGYLKDLLWWAGLLSMAVGEAANFMAYTFAPASLVSTLGVLSVLVTAILSSKYLNERLNFLGKVGCFLCTIGSTIIVIHAPMEKDIASMYDLQIKLTNIVFVFYVLITIVVSVILIYHFLPKLPDTSTYTLLIWIGVCSMIGSLSVMSVKGLGLAMMQTIGGVQNEMNNWLTWFCFVTLVVCISVQMNFLNKALDTFNTAVVTPIYYVFFTSCVILASAILFDEFASLPAKDWIGLLCGFFTVLTAILLLHLCKNFDLTLFTLTQQIEIVNNEHHHHQHDRNAYDAILPVCEMDLKKAIHHGKSRNGGDDDFDDDDEDDDIYKSLDSSIGSLTRKGSLTPDVKLLSGSYSKSDGKRNRNRDDGYMPLSYGTTERHPSQV